MKLTNVTFPQCLFHASEMLLKEANYFSEIDSRFGDGDHGVTITKIATVIKTAIENRGDESLKIFLDNLGTAIMSTSGGAATPLWGTMIGGLAIPLAEDTREIDGELLKAMLASALEEVESITPARIGDKTMMDVLIPAVQAAQNAGNNVHDVLAAVVTAAKNSAKNTENYISRYGRAKNYKEQTLGTPDAGAVSLKVFFEGLMFGASQ